MLTIWEKSRIMAYLEIAFVAAQAMKASSSHDIEMRDVGIARSSELTGLIQAIKERG